MCTLLSVPVLETGTLSLSLLWTVAKRLVNTLSFNQIMTLLASTNLLGSDTVLELSNNRCRILKPSSNMCLNIFLLQFLVKS